MAPKFSRIVDLTLPIESNMPGIPGIKSYSEESFQRQSHCCS